MQRNIKLILEYEGTNYHGWQSQAGSGRKTVQETVGDSLAIAAIPQQLRVVGFGFPHGIGKRSLDFSHINICRTLRCRSALRPRTTPKCAGSAPRASSISK